MLEKFSDDSFVLYEFLLSVKLLLKKFEFEFDLGTSTQYTKKRVKHGAFACIFVMFYMQKNCGNTEYLNEWIQKSLSPLNKNEINCLF